MKKIAMIILMMAVSTSAFAMASSGTFKDLQASQNTANFYSCLADVSLNKCHNLTTNFGDATALANYNTCYNAGRAKCGCTFNIASECK